MFSQAKASGPASGKGILPPVGLATAKGVRFERKGTVLQTRPAVPHMPGADSMISAKGDDGRGTESLRNNEGESTDGSGNDIGKKVVEVLNNSKDILQDIEAIIEALSSQELQKYMNFQKLSGTVAQAAATVQFFQALAATMVNIRDNGESLIDDARDVLSPITEMADENESVRDVVNKITSSAEKADEVAASVESMLRIVSNVFSVLGTAASLAGMGAGALRRDIGSAMTSVGLAMQALSVLLEEAAQSINDNISSPSELVVGMAEGNNDAGKLLAFIRIAATLANLFSVNSVHTDLIANLAGLASHIMQAIESNQSSESDDADKDKKI